MRRENLGPLRWLAGGPGRGGEETCVTDSSVTDIPLPSYAARRTPSTRS